MSSFSFEDLELKYVTLPSTILKLSFDDSGENRCRDSSHLLPLVICLPGAGDIRTQFRMISPLLHSLGFRVLRLDLRGMGDSDREFSDYSSEACGSDIRVILDHIDGYDKERGVILIGHGFGASVAIWAAGEWREEVKQLVLLSPILRAYSSSHSSLSNSLLLLKLKFPWGPALWTNHIKSMFKNSPSDLNTESSKINKSLSRRHSMEALHKMLTHTTDASISHASLIMCPILVVTGSEDKIFDGNHSELEFAHKVLPIQNTTFIQIDGSGHYPHIESPKEFVEQFRKWRRKVLRKAGHHSISSSSSSSSNSENSTFGNIKVDYELAHYNDMPSPSSSSGQHKTTPNASSPRDERIENRVLNIAF